MTSPGKRTVEAASASAAGPAGDGVGHGDGPIVHPLRTEDDLITIRHAVRAATIEAGFGLVDQTRVVTAASELARNAYVHGGGGTLAIEHLRRTDRRGLRLVVSDDGPGIPVPEAALTDGYTTGAGLGHGLGGARRLMHEFHLRTSPGRGTTIAVTRWVTR